MWIFSKDGFVSVVQHRDDKDIFLIRGRIKEDVEDIANLAEKLTGTKYELIRMTDADYEYRVFLHKEVFKKVMNTKFDQLDYPNFKNSIKDSERHNAYLDVWSVMYNFAENIKNSTSDYAG